MQSKSKKKAHFVKILNIFQKIKINLFSIGFDTISSINSLLVDCGAMAHVLTNESKFISFGSDFNPENHQIELAVENCHKKVTLTVTQGNMQNYILKDAFYIPTYKQYILCTSHC